MCSSDWSSVWFSSELNVACFQPMRISQVYFAIDFWCVCLLSTGRTALIVCRVDNHGQRTANFCLKLGGADRGRFFHDSLIALFLDFFGNRVGQGICRCALDRFEAEGSNAVELRFIQPIEKILEIRLCLAREADDKAGTDRNVRTYFAPVPNPRIGRAHV